MRCPLVWLPAKAVLLCFAIMYISSSGLAQLPPETSYALEENDPQKPVASAASSMVTGEPKRQHPSGMNAPLDPRRGPRVGGYFLQRWNDRFDTKASTKGLGTFAPLKHLELSDDIFITLSGEERIRTVAQDYGNFAGGGLKKGQGYVAFRHQYGTDIHIGTDIRAFGQIVSAQQPGFGIPKPYPGKQQNSVDLAELFVEISRPLGRGRIGARVGRQQMTLGNGLLFALQPAANVEQAHEGVVAYANSADADITVFAIKPVTYAIGAFDDRNSDTQKFLGAYGSLRLSKKGNGGFVIDPFFVRSIDTQSTINRISGADRRWTAGARLWGSTGLLSLDWTTAYQWGEFAGKPVSAAAVFSDTQVKIPTAPANMRVSIRADLATGGPRDSRTVKTFRPFFHAQLYQTIMGYLTPANSFDLGAGLLGEPSRKIALQTYYRRFWRYSSHDLVYGRGFAPLNSTAGYDNKAVGDLWAVSGRLQIDQNLSLTLNGGIFGASDKSAGSGLKHTKSLTGEILFLF